jgi:hypothetical protein
MHVRLGSSDFMEEHAGRFDDAFFQKSVGDRLDGGRQRGCTLLSVPGKVEIDFAVVVAGRGAILRNETNGSSRNSEKTRKRGCGATSCHMPTPT